ncbi:hypothetical protein Tco_1198484 [Tanacetum coccineum]
MSVPRISHSDVEENLKNHRQAARGVQKEAAVASKEYCTTPIAERIDKIERKVIGVKLTLVDDDEKPLPKVVSTKNVDSDSEVEYVIDDHVIFMASAGLKRGAD